jgi:hypothetical protein
MDPASDVPAYVIARIKLSRHINLIIPSLFPIIVRNNSSNTGDMFMITTSQFKQVTLSAP